MAKVNLGRKTSTWIARAEPKKRKGNNTPSLGLSNNSEKTRYAYVTFAIPREVLDPRNVLESATLRLRNGQPWPGSHTLTVSRVSTPWAASKLTWNGRPTATGAETLTKSGAGKGSVWDVNVIDLVNQMRSGNLNLGFRIATNKTGNVSILNRGANAPRLMLTYYVRPGVPTTLAPTDQTAVSVAKPKVMVVDAEIRTSGLTGIQVQQSATSNWSNPGWDSGAVSTSLPQLDLAAYSGSLPVAENGEMYWRIRLRGAGNVWSSWSAASRYVRKSLGTVTITYPPESAQVTDPSPPVDWELVGGSGTQSAYRVILRVVHAASGSVIGLWDSGLQASTDSSVSASPPAYVNLPLTTAGDPLSKWSHYEYEVRVWDSVTRSSTVGGPEYVSAKRSFEYVLGSGVPAVSSLTATPMDPQPFVKLTWTRDEAPDEYVIVRDGESITKISGPDLLVVDDRYEYIDVTASPRNEHTWTVRSVVNGVTSPGNPLVSARSEGGGIWLSDPENDAWVCLLEPEPEMAHSEEGSTHQVLRASSSVRITTSLRGYSGRVTGELYATELTGDLTGSELYDEFMRIRQEYTGKRMYLSLNDMVIPVIVFDMTAAPTSTVGNDGDYLYTASFSFFEVTDVQ